jgi:putative PIN family toxin of toxin-antitoxin system
VTARIVLDTNVCLDLFVFDDPWCAALHDAFGKGLEAVTRDDCRAEWVRVLGYPQFALDADAQAKAVAAYDASMRMMPVIDIELPRCKDPDDQKFLELAWTAQAGVLLTKDKELLVLARRAELRERFAIMKPAEWTAEASHRHPGAGQGPVATTDH